MTRDTRPPTLPCPGCGEDRETREYPSAVEAYCLPCACHYHPVTCYACGETWTAELYERWVHVCAHLVRTITPAPMAEPAAAIRFDDVVDTDFPSQGDPDYFKHPTDIYYDRDSGDYYTGGRR